MILLRSRPPASIVDQIVELVDLAGHFFGRFAHGGQICQVQLHERRGDIRMLSLDLVDHGLNLDKIAASEQDFRRLRCCEVNGDLGANAVFARASNQGYAGKPLA